MLVYKKRDNHKRLHQYKKKNEVVRIKNIDQVKLLPDTLYFLPLGGTGEFGSNFNLYCYNGKWIIVDIGVSFDHNNMALIMPDLTFVNSIDPKDVLGIFITHAHYDHLGGLAHLWKYMPYPAYMTPFTLNFFHKQIIDIKAKQYNDLHEVKYGEQIDLGEFIITYRPTPHSIPDSAMLIIKTKSGSILHTGDWRSEKTPVLGDKDETTLVDVMKKENMLAVVGDSTNAMTPDTLPSETEVQASLMNKVKAITKGRIVIVCFSTHVSRVFSCASIAQECNRKIALVGRSLHRMKEVSDALGYFDSLNNFITEDQAKDLDRDQVLIVCTGSQGEDWSGLKRLSENEHPKIKLETGDTVIVSARMIIGRERQIYDMINRFSRMGVKTITSDNDKTIHVSGHPPQGDLKALYSAIKPHWVIPVHGEHRHLKAHSEVAKSINIKSFIPENGDLIIVTESSCSKIADIHFGKTLLDGNIIIQKEGQVTAERASLSYGCVMINVMIYENCKDNTPRFLTAIKFHGACSNHEIKLKHRVKNILNDTINSKLTLDICQNPQQLLGPAIRSEIQKVIFKERGTDPQIFVSILSTYAINKKEVEYIDDKNQVF